MGRSSREACDSYLWPNRICLRTLLAFGDSNEVGASVYAIRDPCIPIHLSGNSERRGRNLSVCNRKPPDFLRMETGGEGGSSATAAVPLRPDYCLGEFIILRILNLIQCANLGGMEQSNLLRLTALMRLGHSCRMISLQPIGGLRPLLEESGIPAEGLHYRGPGGLAVLRPLRRALRRSPADAIIMTGHNLLAMLALGSICREHRVLAIHFHHEGVKPARFWRMFYSLAIKRFGAITFPSDFVREEAERLCPDVSLIAQTVPNPFRVPDLVTPEVKLRARRTLGVPQEAFLVGNAGWLIARKRWVVFLDSAQIVLQTHPEARFLVAGEGPERVSLEAQASRLGISHCVVWLGWQSDLTLFYQSLDVLLFHSDWDALGRTPLEALAYGIPVVASVGHGGLGEVLLDGYGFLANRHDPEWLASKIQWIRENPQAAIGMAVAGRTHLQVVGSPEAHAARMSSLLQGS